MANNFIQEGDTLTIAPAANVTAGTGYQFGEALFGVALTNATAGIASAFATEGVWELSKTSALAIAVGDKLYWDAANKVVNKTDTGLFIGVAVSAAANPSTTVRVRLLA